jgi:hypothetical protein
VELNFAGMVDAQVEAFENQLLRRNSRLSEPCPTIPGWPHRLSTCTRQNHIVRYNDGE